MASLTINGEKKEFVTGAPATLAELLRTMDVSEATIVAEVDGEIIQRGTFADVKLRDGQTVELIRFVGGG
jgi:sulfur carrier protein